MIKTNCDYCSKEITMKNNQYKSSKKHFCCRSHIRKYYSENRIPKEQLNELIELYNGGHPLKELASKLGFKSIFNIRKTLIANGVHIRTKLEASVFSNTPEKSRKLSEGNKGKIRTEACKLNLSLKKTKFKLSKGFLIEEYITKNKSGEDIAREIGCTSSCITWKLRRFGIPRKTLSSYESYWKGRKNPALRERNLKDNPSKRPDVREKRSIFQKQRCSNPEEMQRLIYMGRENAKSNTGRTYEEISGVEKASRRRNKFDKWQKENITGKKVEEIYGEEKALRYRKIVSASKQGISLDNWTHFIRAESYDKKWDNHFKNLIRKRDNQICMNCGIHREKLNVALSVHHINYDKKLTVKENCISLCSTCHLFTNTNRIYWCKLLQDKLSKLYGYKYTEDGKPILEVRYEN